MSTIESEVAWRPHRFLVAADHVAGLADYVLARRPDLEVRTRATADLTAEDLDWAEVFVGFRRPPLAGWGGVRWIHSIGAGVDAFVFRRPLAPGLRLTRSAEDYGPAIGEWCLARALAANQHLHQLARSQAQRVWGPRDDPIPLRGQHVVILGTGMVGRGIARAFGSAGCRVVGLSRRGRPAPDFVAVESVDRFAEVVRGAHWLVLAAPLTEATFHWLDRPRLSQCGGVYVMNVGRGALIDEPALPEALTRGWIRGAALDVFETEPLPADSPLWGLPGVVISPHISGPSTIAATADGLLQCLAAFERGEAPPWLVSPEGY
jgi:phosphoglycerate dehydrogenase-like enzyme